MRLTPLARAGVAEVVIGAPRSDVPSIDGPVIEGAAITGIKIEGVLAPHYALLRFDDHDRCQDVELVSVNASTKEESLGL